MTSHEKSRVIDRNFNRHTRKNRLDIEIPHGYIQSENSGQRNKSTNKPNSQEELYL